MANGLLQSWRVLRGQGAACRFDRLTFTVQREVADRLAAGPASHAYGLLSVLVALLGRLTPGPAVPASAFWPAPKVASRMMRIDFDPQAAGRLADADVLQAALALAFGQRRKQIGAIARKGTRHFSAQALTAALDAAGIDPRARAERVPPEQFLALANDLAQRA